MKSEKMPTNKNKDLADYFSYWYSFLNLVPRKQLLLSILYGGTRTIVSAIWPFLLYRILKEISVQSHNQLLLYVGLMVCMLALVALATQLQSKVNIVIIKDFTLEIINKIWKKMNALDWQTFHGKNRVYYFDLLMVETWRLRGGLAALLESLIINSLIATVLSLFILFISWPLFILCISGLIIMGLGYYVASLRIKPLLKQFHKAWRVQHHWVAKSVDQFDLIKMDRAYEFSASTNVKNSSIFLEVNSKLLANQAKWRNINQLLSNLVRITIFVVGAYWVQLGRIGLDDFLLTLLVVSIVQSNIMQLPSALNSFIEAQESLKTLSEFFSTKDEQPSGLQSKIDLPQIKRISIRNLSYAYDEKLVIDHVNLDLEVGKIYLWRGPNGSGKSTAANILLGLIMPKQGSLTINGQVLDWEDLRSLRNRFAFLNQDSPIFMGSLEENILFGHTHPEEARAELQTTWLSGLLPFSKQAINRLVGEKGEGLSGGEAKRIALIRELLRSSELLILDEPLNHLDEYAINEIKREILTIKSKTIIIIISHQLGFENIADEIKEF